MTEPMSQQRRAAPSPKFVTGSLLRHVLVMTSAGALGLMAIFIGDLANVYFLSLLKDEAVVAAVGYASSILFLTISIGIGLSIAATSLVSPAIGAGEMVRARRLSVNAHLASALVSFVLGAAVFVFISPLLGLLGATGRTHALAATYLRILMPSLPFLAVAMASAAVLRSVGDARRAMNVTLIIAIVNTALDPILILWLGWGIEGAAIASTAARLAAFVVGLYGVVRVHGLMGTPRWKHFIRDVPALGAIAVPAVLTNVATPFANAYVTAAIAPFGDSAVAAWAIIGRILPVAFGAIYALSGSIGPIVGQNFGAGEFQRVRETFTNALLSALTFTLAAWFVLAVFAEPLASAFNAMDEAKALIVLYCRWLSPFFLFLGALFVANAVFNTLGKPSIPTLLNWGRASIGTVPFVEAGARWAGAEGVLWGNTLGAVLFGGLAVWLCYRLISKLELASANEIAR